MLFAWKLINCYTSSYILPLIKSTSKGDSKSNNVLIGLMAGIDSIVII